jgi:hypothetical protein
MLLLGFVNMMETPGVEHGNKEQLSRVVKGEEVN